MSRAPLSGRTNILLQITYEIEDDLNEIMLARNGDLVHVQDPRIIHDYGLSPKKIIPIGYPTYVISALDAWYKCVATGSDDLRDAIKKWYEEWEDGLVNDDGHWYTGGKWKHTTTANKIIEYDSRWIWLKPATQYRYYKLHSGVSHYDKAAPGSDGWQPQKRPSNGADGNFHYPTVYDGAKQFIVHGKTDIFNPIQSTRMFMQMKITNENGDTVFVDDEEAMKKKNRVRKDGAMSVYYKEYITHAKWNLGFTLPEYLCGDTYGEVYLKTMDPTYKYWRSVGTVTDFPAETCKKNIAQNYYTYLTSSKESVVKSGWDFFKEWYDNKPTSITVYINTTAGNMA
jgi:hypothetical protein